jgi:GNAT superfamily N-acetyltransferase
MQITTVNNPRDLEAFIRLPYQVYRADPHWVAPLRGEVRAQFNPRKNPTLDHCEHALFLLRNGDQVIGRVAAFIDRLAMEHWGEAVGLFGYYECAPVRAAANLLLDAARQWLRARGMARMRGPWSFISQEWGSVVEGFTPPAVIMSPYNPPFYNDHYAAFGLQKARDLLVYVVDARDGYQIPERILRLTDRVAARHNLRVRTLDMKQYEQEVARVIELSNISLADNWGYAPVTRAEAAALARNLKPILHPKAVVFAEDAGGRAIGFAIAIPDVNKLIKGLNGRLLPFALPRLLFGLPRLRQYRMFALGVLPEYHGQGVDSLMYRALYESCYSPDVRMEINYVLEDNHPMNNAILKLGAKPLRRYRVYEMDI